MNSSFETARGALRRLLEIQEELDNVEWSKPSTAHLDMAVIALEAELSELAECSLEMKVKSQNIREDLISSGLSL
jgi:hypothetical protein